MANPVLHFNVTKDLLLDIRRDPAATNKWLAKCKFTIDIGLLNKMPELLELEYRQYLERAAYGVQPAVRVGARVYRGPCADDGVDTAGLVGDADPALAASPYLAALLPKLAKLHAGVVAMAAARGGRGPALGVSQREGYVFSRRALGAVLDALRSLRRVDARGGVVDFASDPEAVVQEALDSVYLHRLRTPEDRAAVLGLMRAIGLRGAGAAVRASGPQDARA